MPTNPWRPRVPSDVVARPRLTARILDGLAGPLTLITNNDTGFSQPDDWWDISATIPGSAGVDTVKVTCGEDVLATLAVRTTG